MTSPGHNTSWGVLPNLTTFVPVSVITCFGVDVMKSHIWCRTITLHPTSSSHFTGGEFSYFRSHTVCFKIFDDIHKVGETVHSGGCVLHLWGSLWVSNNNTFMSYCNIGGRIRQVFVYVGVWGLWQISDTDLTRLGGWHVLEGLIDCGLR